MLEDNGYSVAESVNDLKGWEVLLEEDWKSGVKRLYLRKENSFQMVYASDGIVQEFHDLPDLR
jgi:hypothetical protein